MAALHKHAYTIWKSLEQAAKPHEMYGEGNPVFVGNYSTVWDAVGASKTYYSKVRKYLLENRYIEIVEQGSNNRPSIIVLWKEPPEDVPTEQGANVKSDEERLTLARRFDTLEERVQALMGWRESLGGLNLAEALRNMELRLANLEANNGSGESG